MSQFRFAFISFSFVILLIFFFLLLFSSDLVYLFLSFQLCLHPCLRLPPHCFAVICSILLFCFLLVIPSRLPHRQPHTPRLPPFAGRWEEVGQAPLLSLLAREGGLPMLEPDWTGADFEVMSKLARLRRTLGLMHLVQVTVEPDSRNTSRNLIHVRLGSWNLLMFN